MQSHREALTRAGRISTPCARAPARRQDRAPRRECRRTAFGGGSPGETCAPLLAVDRDDQVVIVSDQIRKNTRARFNGVPAEVLRQLDALDLDHQPIAGCCAFEKDRAGQDVRQVLDNLYSGREGSATRRTAPRS